MPGISFASAALPAVAAAITVLLQLLVASCVRLHSAACAPVGCCQCAASSSVLAVVAAQALASLRLLQAAMQM